MEEETVKTATFTHSGASVPIGSESKLMLLIIKFWDNQCCFLLSVICVLCRRHSNLALWFSLLCSQFPHIDVTGVHPCSGMHDPVHNRIGVDTAAQSAVPVLTLVLCTENRGGAVIAALYQLKDEMLFAFRHIVEQPFIKDQ